MNTIVDSFFNELEKISQSPSVPGTPQQAASDASAVQKNVSRFNRPMPTQPLLGTSPQGQLRGDLMSMESGLNAGAWR